METPRYPKGHPQVANVAINQARNLARNFARVEKGQAQKSYEYRDLGSMATIGRNKAVVDLPFFRFKGCTAWLVWMFLHLMLILSVRKDRKSTRLNSSHVRISYAVFCLKKKSISSSCSHC